MIGDETTALPPGRTILPPPDWLSTNGTGSHLRPLASQSSQGIVRSKSSRIAYSSPRSVPNTTNRSVDNAGDDVTFTASSSCTLAGFGCAAPGVLVGRGMGV